MTSLSLFAIKSTSFMEVYKMKTYEAYVARNAIDYFCNQLTSRGGKIKQTGMGFSENGEIIYHMIVEAPEGIIDPKWEVKG